MSDKKSDETPTHLSATNLPKAYDPSIIEQRWADYWVRERIFEVPDPATDSPDDSTGTFTLLLPPPNVTGRLHMGHMLNQTEIDILMRWHRMSGETALWVPGTDHAGIATQMMVERQLAAEGLNRKDMTREEFVEKVWAWKVLYGSAITDQMKRLGASVDWSREYFTMDEKEGTDPGDRDLSGAVKEAFVRLWEQGLIYRGSYIVNWDPIQQTAVSDLEVTHEDRLGKLYHIRYPFADGTGSIVVATTRPETMLGDVAVAVNPNDDRYKEFIGKLLTLPLSAAAGHGDREIPILADSWANPEFGTGAVKVTPAHDPNDFAIGQRHNLPSLTILDTSAHISLAGSPYFGLDRFAARERIVADLEAAGLLVAVKDHNLAIAVSQRSGAVIEPRLSLQWFLAVNKPVDESRPSIAQTAIDAVREGHIKFTPEMYEKTYFEWMNNIHDWCISRQLWWGHRIPAWHCTDCSEIIVSRDTPTVCKCGSTNLTQETDVLDTWFSSGLLPFTVFGWPNPDPDTGAPPLTPGLAAFYPTSLLITGFDILFFWVARMVMLGTHFMLDVPMPDAAGGLIPRTLAESVPFREVYIHALVRDANREKMSKTKGNVIDPIEIIERFGTDAVRFTLASMASPGTDIAFSEARTEGNRAFANKIWNAARFLFMNLDRAREAGYEIPLPAQTVILSGARSAQSKDPEGPNTTETVHPFPTSNTQTTLPENTPLETRWIFSRLSTVSAEVHRALTEYRFDEAANAIYQFFWGEFCDWYLELVKLRLNFDEPKNDATALTLASLIHVFESALRLLSPFMPFLTEEIWHALYNNAPPAKSIALTRYPQATDFPIDSSGEEGMNRVMSLIGAIRARRKELGVPEKELTTISIVYDARSDIGTTNPAINNVYIENQAIILRLARVSAITEETLDTMDLIAPTQDWIQALGPLFYLPFERTIDIPAERERLTKDLAKYEKGLLASDRQLSNESFMAKAPAHIVEGLRKQAAETRTLYDKTKAALEALPPN